MNKENKQLFRYEPAETGREKMAYSWRMSIRNFANSQGFFSNMPSLEEVEKNMEKPYDEWLITNDGEKFLMKVHGNGNYKIDDPKIEFKCELSKKDLVNKLIDNIPL